MVSTGVVAVVIGAGLTACTTGHTEAKAQPAPSVAPKSVPVGPDDTTGIVTGRCAPTVPARPVKPSPLPTGNVPGGSSGSPSLTYPPPAAMVPLVPIVASRMILCRYNGMNEAPIGGLRHAEVVTDGTLVERWRSRFNHLRALPSRPRSCPLDDARELRIAFVASPQSYVVLATRLSGCGIVTNGVEARDMDNAADLQFGRDLARLAGG
jgi:hypothetical protein